MNAAAAIELAGVRAVRDGRAVLDGLDLRVATGERVAVLGTNGVGKSTLLDVLTGLVRAEGSVRVLGAAPPAPGIGFVGQDAGASLLPWLSVRDNVELPLRLRGGSPRDRAAAFDEVRALLDPRARIEPTRRAHALSGGEAQLVALMRAWIGPPRLVVLDEPLSAIDPLSRVRAREALSRGLERYPETTLLLVTHDLADVSALATRAVVLGGRPARVAATLRIERGETDGVLAALEAAARPPAEALPPAAADALSRPGSVRA